MYRWFRYVHQYCRRSLRRSKVTCLIACCLIVSVALISVQLFGGARLFGTPKISETVTTSTLTSQQHSDAINDKDEFSSTNNSAWIESRQMLLKKKDGVSKVLLYTYMRGGSSVFSQIFNIDQTSTVLFFESLDSFYRAHFGLRLFSLPMAINYYRNLTRRIPGEIELSEMTQFLENLFSCRIDKLPVELLAHRQFLEQADIFKDMVRICIPSRSGNHSLYCCTNYLGDICGGLDLNRPNITHAILRRCPDIIRALKIIKPQESHTISTLDRVRNQLTQHIGTLPTNLQLTPFLEHYHCVNRLENPSRLCWNRFGQKKCHRAKLIVAKLTRASLPDLYRLIERNPDIRVIYYARDPRATAVSRIQNGSKLMFAPRDRNSVLEARALCAQMREDLRARRHLDRKYPGALLTIRYEDFISDTHNVTRKVFEYVGRPVPARFSWWAKNALYGRVDNGMFGRKRSNATVVMDKWRSMVSHEAAIDMTGYCRDVLDELGYNL